jgi:WD repeat-containing protein 19
MSQRLFSIDAGQHAAGTVIMSWNKSGRLLASCGSNKTVHIHDKFGKVVFDFVLTKGACAALEWDKDGDCLAASQTGSSCVSIFEVHSKAVYEIDTGLKETSCICWSSTTPHLAIGTVKGHLMIYNKLDKSKVPVQGRHSKRIACAAWNSNAYLALASDDKQLSFQDQHGNGLNTAILKAEPTSMEFVQSKVRTNAKEQALAVCAGRKSIYVFESSADVSPSELKFADKYGAITCFQTFDDKVVVGFGSGVAAVYLMQHNQLKDELVSIKMFESVTNVVYNSELGRVAVVGSSSTVKFIDTVSFIELKEESITHSSAVETVAWTGDGLIIALSSRSGDVGCYLARLPALQSVYGAFATFLSSLREVSIVNVVSADLKGIKVQLPTEPSCLGLGPHHLAAASQDSCSFFSLKASGTPLCATNSYLGAVSKVCLNKTHAAVLSDGYVQFHEISSLPSSGNVFPKGDSGKGDDRATCIWLSDDFLIYGTRHGSLVMVLGSTGNVVLDYRHTCGIVKVFASKLATRLIFLDSNGMTHLFSPMHESRLDVPKLSSVCDVALFDLNDDDVFVVMAGSVVHTFVYQPISINDPSVTKLDATTTLSGSGTPMQLINGLLYLHVRSGSVASLALATHSSLIQRESATTATQELAKFRQLLDLRKIPEAWDVVAKLNAGPAAQPLQELSQIALASMEIEIAMRAHRKLGNASLALALSKLLECEELNVLAAQAHILLGNYDEAQRRFLQSSQPSQALAMRADLMQWDVALQLAQQLKPSDIPIICKQHAASLEFQCEYRHALQMYEKAEAAASDDELKRVCAFGMARMHMRCGNLAQGLKIADRCSSKPLFRECAAILESMKQWNESGLMYEKATMLDKAAQIYMAAKNYTEVAKLLAGLDSPKLLSEYGKAMEGMKKYKEALQAYQKSGDLEAQVRILIDHLNAAPEALALVRLHKMVSCADFAAKFCQSQGDHRGCIEFLLLAKKPKMAMDTARQHDLLDVLAQFLGDDASAEDYNFIAQHYERQQNSLQAAEFYLKAQMYEKSVRLFMTSGDSGMERAIDVCGAVGKDDVTHMLRQYLLGESRDSDGTPKDPKWIYKLHMRLGNYDRAGKSAAVICDELLSRAATGPGFYTKARDVLRDAQMDLAAKGRPPPAEVSSRLRLLHSYNIVRGLNAREEHVNAARMLVRIRIRIRTPQPHSHSHSHSQRRECVSRCFIIHRPLRCAAPKRPAAFSPRPIKSTSSSSPLSASARMQKCRLGATASRRRLRILMR